MFNIGFEELILILLVAFVIVGPKDLPKVARYLHVPAQSGCNDILKRMKRGYTVEDYREMMSRINDIVLERRGITADTALRLSHFFGGDAQSWLNLQTAYDLRVAELDKTLQAAVMAVHPLEFQAA